MRQDTSSGCKIVPAPSTTNPPVLSWCHGGAASVYHFSPFCKTFFPTLVNQVSSWLIPELNGRGSITSVKGLRLFSENRMEARPWPRWPFTLTSLIKPACWLYGSRSNHSWRCLVWLEAPLWTLRPDWGLSVPWLQVRLQGPYRQAGGGDKGDWSNWNLPAERHRTDLWSQICLEKCCPLCGEDPVV